MQKLQGFTALVVVVVLFILVVAVSPFAVVNAGHVGVVTTFGKVSDTVLTEGFHVVMPWNRVHALDVRTQKTEVVASSASRDLQTVSTRVALNYHVNPIEANKLYQQIGIAYDDTIIQPAMQESVKSATAQFTAEELITKRAEVKSVIQKELEGRLASRHIVVDEFSIIDFSFSEEFNRAIEAKQTAEQQALKAERDLDRIRLEAQQEIEKAKAEAEALKLQRQQITPELLQLRWIEKWDGKVPQYWGGTSPFVGINR